MRFHILSIFFTTSLMYGAALGEDDSTPLPKTFEWRFGLHYDMNFTSFSNKKTNFLSSQVSGAELRLGILYRPVRHFGIELATGVGVQTTRFMHNGKPNEVDPADLAYVESLFSGEFLQKIKDAMYKGDLSGVWNAFDWSKLNYDYQRTTGFDERISSYVFPFEIKLNYFINNDWAVYTGGVYHRGGLIDDARVFAGLAYKVFDVRLGYIVAINDHFHGEYSRVTRSGGAPLSLTLGAMF